MKYWRQIVTKNATKKLMDNGLSIIPLRYKIPQFIYKHGLNLHTMKWVRIIILQSTKILKADCY